MNINQLNTILKQNLQGILPGDAVRGKMAPGMRVPPNWNPDKSKARKAGVLALMYPHTMINGEVVEAHLALMRRTEDGYAHSGQISFPGGGVEEQDADLIATALRETEEEFGVDASQIEIVGTLSEMYIPVSNSLVLPSVGILHARPNFVPQEKEVAEIIEVPISYLLDEKIIKQKDIETRGGFKIPAHYYDVYGHVVWGATAMMISELLAVIKENF